MTLRFSEMGVGQNSLSFYVIIIIKNPGRIAATTQTN